MTGRPPDRSVAFLHGPLAIGGIEQLLVRVGRVLKERGWRVQFVLQSRTTTSLDAEAAAIGPVHLLPTDYRDAWRRVADVPLEPTSVLFAPTSDAFLLAHLIRQRRTPGARIVAGVYFPLEYANPAAHRVYEIGRAAGLLARCPAQNVVFMNEACRDAHVAVLGPHLAASPVIPVPFESRVGSRGSARPASRRLVSVGRLVDFKGYPFGALDALDELRDEGRDLTYDVYGSGPLAGELQRAVDARGLGAVVRLLGEVPPARFTAVLDDALAFLGMGTAAVEAAGHGVPTVLAAVGERRPVVHGWFGDQEGYGVGEVRAGDALQPLADLLREVDDADADGYRRLSESGRVRAERFGLEPAVDLLEAALLAALPSDDALTVLDLVRGWGSRAHDAGRVRRGRPSRRSTRYLPPSLQGARP
jgi:glycosyltransferase involved in cell wall biosynthesis